MVENIDLKTRENVERERKPRVLALDRDDETLDLLEYALTKQDLEVISSNNDDTARFHLDSGLGDIVIFDPDGFNLSVENFRNVSKAPLIVITENEESLNAVEALKYGADYLIHKPFNPDLLAAHIRASLRRSDREEQRQFAFGDLLVDLDNRAVTNGGETVQFTRTEWELFESMVKNNGRVMLGTELLTRVWGPEFRNDDQYLRVWVSRIRKKLKGREELIRTFQGLGYMLGEPAVIEAGLDYKKEVEDIIVPAKAESNDKVDPSVLVIDRDPSSRTLIKYSLRGMNFDTRLVGDKKSAELSLWEARPNLIMVSDDFRLQQSRDAIPYIVLGGPEGNEIDALDGGAINYYGKPANPDEMKAFVQSAMTKITERTNPDKIVKAGDVEVNLTTNIVKKGGSIVRLTATEFRLITVLAQNIDKGLTNESLAISLGYFGRELESDMTQYVRVYISRLRKKLGGEESFGMVLKTLSGVGYTLTAENGHRYDQKGNGK